MPGVELNEHQKELRFIVENNLKKLRDDIREGNKLPYDEIQIIYKTMAKAAHELHMSLDPKPKHHRYMIENRGVQSDHPDFYNHIHPTEDLIDYLDDIHANDDPVDQTLNKSFKFSVYSRRWGHEDTYTITRNKDGWYVSFHDEGQGNNKAAPILYNVLNHDSINYPEELPGYMEWLWLQAEEQGLSYDQVQYALNQLAEWINICEKNSPDGIFDAFK